MDRILNTGRKGREREKVKQNTLTLAPMALVANYFVKKKRRKNTVYAEDGHSFTFNSIARGIQLCLQENYI